MEAALESLARTICLDLLERSRLATEAMGVDWKGSNDPVTEADHAAHRAVAEALPDLTPDVPLVSEEDADSGTVPETFWSLDPVDGTQEFMAHLGEWAFQLALVSQGQPVLAVLGIPSRDVIYLASQGRGCRRGALSAPGMFEFTSRPPVRRQRLVLTRSFPRRPSLKKIVDHHPAQDHILLGGVGYKVHALLCGEGDTYFSAPGTLHAWDLAAPLLVAREAGLVTCATDGSALEVPGHRRSLAQGVLFTRPAFLDSDLGFFRDPEIAALLAHKDPR